MAQYKQVKDNTQTLLSIAGLTARIYRGLDLEGAGLEEILEIPIVVLWDLLRNALLSELGITDFAVVRRQKEALAAAREMLNHV